MVYIQIRNMKFISKFCLIILSVFWVFFLILLSNPIYRSEIESDIKLTNFWLPYILSKYSNLKYITQKDYKILDKFDNSIALLDKDRIALYKTWIFENGWWFRLDNLSGNFVNYNSNDPVISILYTYKSDKYKNLFSHNQLYLPIVFLKKDLENSQCINILFWYKFNSKIASWCNNFIINSYRYLEKDALILIDNMTKDILYFDINEY